MSEPVWRAALLGLGSNLGDRLATLQAAARRLAGSVGVRAVRVSGVYASPPLGNAALYEFLNAALWCETRLAPRALLELALAVEADHQRVRTVHWGPRTLDIDILWIDGMMIAEPGLTVPHPGLAQRAFVLRPVAELAPELVLPDGRTVAAAVKELVDDACVRLPGQDLGIGG